MEEIFTSVFMWVLHKSEKVIHNLSVHEVLVIVIFLLGVIFSFMFLYKKHTNKELSSLKNGVNSSGDKILEIKKDFVEAKRVIDNTHDLILKIEERMKEVRSLQSKLESQINVLDKAVQKVDNSQEPILDEIGSLSKRLINLETKIVLLKQNLENNLDLIKLFMGEHFFKGLK